MPFFSKRHPRLRLAAAYFLALSLLVTYYCWQLTRDNQRLFVFVYEGFGGGFVDVTHSFLHGQLSTLWPPDPKFADLKNPYSQDEREAHNVSFPWDFSYYRAPGEKLGKYYYYFQPGPVLLFYLPQYFLTGQLPSERWVMFLLSNISLLFYAAFLRLIVKNYFPNVPVSLEVLLIFTYGLCNMNTYLQADFAAYQMAICGGTDFAMGCILFIYLAIEAKAARVWWLLLAGICAGLAFGFRPTCFFLNILLVFTWFYLLWKKYKFAFRWIFLWESIALFLPPLLCCLASAWYNYARFNNIFEFGVTYELNGGECMRYKHFLLSYIPDSIWSYFLQPWHPNPHFPYVDIESGDDFTRFYPDRFRMDCSGMFPNFPISLLGFAWPFYLRAQLPEKREHIAFLGLLVSLWGGIITLVVCAYFAIEQRYVAEPLFAMIILVTFTLLMRRQAGAFHVWEKVVLFLLLSYSFYMGIVFGLTGQGHWIQGKLHDLYGW